jgi:hypothetical protein
MRGVLAVIWAVVVFLVVLVVVQLCATLGFPPGSTSGNIMRIAGVIIALGLAINAYRRSRGAPNTSDKTPPAV